MTPFTELDHRLSVVKRWCILHTLQEQSVAEHVHNVVRIVYRIAGPWFDLNHQELLTAVTYAHFHDDEESLVGDPPAMIKPYFDSAAFRADHADLLTVDTDPPARIRNIVKLADKMEGMQFLAMELALGNQYVREHYKAEFGIIGQMVKERFDQPVYLKVMDWLSELDTWPPKSTRHSRRGQ